MMLIHLTPKLYAPNLTHLCQLVDFRSHELGIHFKNGADLVACRPWPNKGYMAASRKVGQKAMTGFLVETLKPIVEFNTVTRWAFGADRILVHRVKYVILDAEFDAISDDPMLWGGSTERGWASRYPKELMEFSPLQLKPVMEVKPRIDRKGACSLDQVRDGIISERYEVFRIHSLERERVLFKPERPDCSIYGRMPDISMAFSLSKQ